MTAFRKRVEFQFFKQLYLLEPKLGVSYAVSLDVTIALTLIVLFGSDGKGIVNKKIIGKTKKLLTQKIITVINIFVFFTN